MFTYSFIIPHHNCPTLLNRCLNSIPEREDVQIVVVDDNSDDGKKPVIERPGVELLTIGPEETLGAGHARNIGLSRATGKWVLFADADDFYCVDDLLSVLDVYKNAEIDVLYFNFKRQETDMNNIDDSKLQETIENYDGSKEMTDYIRYCNNSPCTKMVRLDFIRSHAMFYEEVPNGNDVLFSLFVGSYAEQFAVSNKRLYAYINTPNSIGTKQHSNDEILCRWIHRMQHNRFNEYIGYPQWNVPIRIIIARFIKQAGAARSIGLLFLLCQKLLFNKGTSNEWVDLIKKHKLCVS